MKYVLNCYHLRCFSRYILNGLGEMHFDWKWRERYITAICTKLQTDLFCLLKSFPFINCYWESKRECYYVIYMCIWLIQIIVFNWASNNNQRESGDNGLFITLVPKVLFKRFLIRWFNNFRDFSKFGLVGSFSRLFNGFNH